MKEVLVAQGKKLGTVTLAGSLHDAMRPEFDRLDVAVAYATLSGIKALEKALGVLPVETRWVVGLDDAITQPEAIDFLLKLPGATVRIASLAAEGRRFHPKLYCLWSSTDLAKGILAVGSGNMTLNGLRKNGEVAILLTGESVEETLKLKTSWLEMWEIGHFPTPKELADYRLMHSAARKVRKNISNLGIAPAEPEPDEQVADALVFDGTPATATVGWTECASPSAGGRDLEFPKGLMPFFQLGNGPVTKRFRMANGASFYLTFTERLDNQMWRLLFSRDSIAAAIGRDSLRPLTGQNRSDLAVIFIRTSGGIDYDVKMVVIGSPDHQNLINRSRAANALFRTRNPGGRYFGLY